MTPKTSFMAVVITLMACSLPITAAGQSKPESPPPMQGPAGWSYFTRGGAVYQFDADIEDDATFNVTRFNLEVGAGYRWNRQDSVGLALGYTYNGYSFSSSKEPGPFADKPWDDIHSLSIGVPMRFGLNSDWST
ncbi:MAG: outer membrane beta-barrel protein, partial [Desulfofustis sp.]|nr:outer membrane beta-barrel protein [Desulfofustis sp.]